MSETSEKKFESWAIVELMGHRRLAGLVTEQIIAGVPMLRIDVLEVPEIDGDPAIPAFTQFYGAQSIYCLTPTTEEIARRITLQRRERPVSLYELRLLPAAPTQTAPAHEPEEEEEEEEFDDV